MKRYRKSVCGFVFTMALCFLYIVPAAAVTPTLNAELKPSADRKTVTVVFSIENNPGIAAFRFTMNYDYTILKPLSTAAGSAITGGTYSDNLGDAAVTVLWYNLKNFTGNGELCSATFSVIGTVKDGKYPIKITYDPADLVAIDPAAPVNQNTKSVVFEVNGMTATVQKVSIQSEPSKPASSAGTSSQAQSIPTSAVSSAVSGTPSLPTNSIAASSYRIEINSRIQTPDYTISNASAAQPVSGEMQTPSQENSQTPSPGSAGASSATTSYQSSQSEVLVQAPDDAGSDLLTVVVLVIAAAAVVALAVLFIKKRKQT